MTAPRRDMSVGFFDDPPTKEVIHALAATDALTIFVGAGASADQRVATWAELVKTLAFDQVCSLNPRVPRAQALSWVDDVKKRYGELFLASIVDQLYQTEHGIVEGIKARNRAIQDVLYPEAVRRSNRLNLSEHILRLAIAVRARRRRVRIITTNYDNLLEHASVASESIRDTLAKLGCSVSHYTHPPQFRPTEIPVIHIHGYIPPDGEAESVVFSEREYANWSTEQRKLRNFVLSSFSTGMTLFLGSSLKDSNIIDLACTASDKGGRRIALLTIQDEAGGAVIDKSRVAKSSGEHCVIRGEHVGIEVLRPDFFGQVAQFCQEGFLAASASESWAPKYYTQRLETWRKEWAKQSRRSLEERAQETSKLERAAVDIRNDLGKDITRLKLEMWVRRHPSRRTLELWYSTQSLRSHHANYWPHTAKIELLSPYAAVAAFATRNTSFGTVHDEKGRWTHFLAIPIILARDPYFNLPVGAITLLLRAQRYKRAKVPPSLAADMETLTLRLANVGSQLMGESMSEPLSQ